MAFNPFSAFRKHQKVWFAILTIVCMIVFILQFGSGDIFQRLLGRGAQGRGDKVATLYGRDVYQSDLTRLAQTRGLVNSIFFGQLTDRGLRQGPVSEAIDSVMDDLVKEQEARDKAKAGNKDAGDAEASLGVRLALQHWKSWTDPNSPFPPAAQNNEIANDLRALAADRRAAPSEEARRRIDSVSAALRYRYWFNGQRLAKPEERQFMVFGGSAKTEDLLDFEIWKYQADHLGIVLNKEDVRKEVAWDAAGRDVLPKGRWRDDAAFRPFVSQQDRVGGGWTEEEILKAITDEYRVSIAQTLLMGHASGVRGVQTGEAGSPDPVTPFDFYTFYRNNRTLLKAAFLPVPVERFVDKVTREPSEDELRRLFDRYKDAVPEPTRAAPAFKEPRRVEVAYVTAKPDSPFYKDKASRTESDRKLALQYLAPTGAQMQATIDRHTAVQMVAAAASPSPGGVAVWAGRALGGPQTLGQEFLTQYNRDVERSTSPGDLWVDPITGRAPELRDPTVGRPADAAALVGRALGGLLTQATPLASPVATIADSALNEANDRLRRAGAALVLGAGGGSPLSAVALAAPSLPAPPPPAALADQVFREFRDERGPQVAFENLSKFIEELTKLRGRPDEASQYVAKAVKEFGFEYHTMERPKDEYELASDPALKELKDAYTRPAAFNPGPKPDFVQELVASSGTFDPKRLSSGGVVEGNGSQNDQNAFFSWMLSSDDRYVFWRSVDDRAHELSYDQARPEVVKAWKLQEARKLALAEANRIEAEARSQASPLEAIKYMRDQKVGEVFELAEIARLMPVAVANPGLEHNFVPYVFPESKIPMAPKGLLDRLMDLDKPGQTLVFKDQPQKTFYVAVLDERVTPGVKDRDFLNAYGDATQPGKDQLWKEYFVADHERDYEQKLLRQLRSEAGAIDETTGALVINKTKEEQRTPQGEPPPPSPADNGHGGDLGF